MTEGTQIHLVVGFVSLVLTMPANMASGQPAEQRSDRNWANSTELGAATSMGNSNSRTVSGRNVYKYVWTEAEFTWETSVLRASSGADRFAVGTEDSFVFVMPENETSHNRLQGKVRFLRTLHDKLFWYVSYDALRDDPSNINRNLVGSGGVGNT